MIAYCGLDCEKCDAFIATKNDDDDLREKTAALWSKLNGVPISAQMINCEGCRENGIKTPFCESFCKIRNCAITKNVETCGNCLKMQSCDILAEITKNNAEASENLSKNI